jgi:hypothetical protein
MNRRSIFSLSVITAFGFALCPGSGFAQQESIKDQLVGAWTVTSQEQARKDGSKVERFGANPKGITIFEANGRFATILARPDLPKLASNDPMKPSPAEAMALAVGSIAYFGTTRSTSRARPSCSRSRPARCRTSWDSKASGSSPPSTRTS